MPNVIELEISTEVEPELDRDMTSLTVVTFENHVAEVGVRAGRFCLELATVEGTGDPWTIDCGPFNPRLRA